jgi:hypothetical protein
MDASLAGCIFVFFPDLPQGDLFGGHRLAAPYLHMLGWEGGRLPLLVKNGTRVTVHWPNSACSILATAEQRFLQMADTPNGRIRDIRDIAECHEARSSAS